MTPDTHRLFAPFLDESTALSLRTQCTRVGPFPVYVENPLAEGFGAGLVRRHDAAMNHLVTGGRFGRHEDPADVMARINLFRATLFTNGQVHLPGFDALVSNQAFTEAACELTGRPLVRPTMLYANILVPGQELPLHTDTPEYRGLDKWKVPEWFLVVMHHSGLFEGWRKQVTAGVAFLNDCDGGDFVLYPKGRDGAPATVSPRFNTAVHLDVDGVFHGVDRVGGPDTAAPPVEPGATLAFNETEQRWHILKDGRSLAAYTWNEVRLSVQWKANCYLDDAEEALCASHRDDLSQLQVIARLTDELRRRGRVTDALEEQDLARLMVEEFVKFPAPVPMSETENLADAPRA